MCAVVECHGAPSAQASSHSLSASFRQHRVETVARSISVPEPEDRLGRVRGKHLELLCYHYRFRRPCNSIEVVRALPRSSQAKLEHARPVIRRSLFPHPPWPQNRRRAEFQRGKELVSEAEQAVA